VLGTVPEQDRFASAQLLEQTPVGVGSTGGKSAFVLGQRPAHLSRVGDDHHAAEPEQSNAEAGAVAAGAGPSEGEAPEEPPRGLRESREARTGDHRGWAP
jgi:hypothetical protein